MIAAADAIARARLCAASNADLHRSVFGAHGLPSRISDAMWWSEQPAPPYYANLITLDPDAAELQREALQRMALALGRGFGVKDSFCRLDLASFGFRALFDATWIWRPSLAASPLPAGWQRIGNAARLAAWEAAWAADSPGDSHVFPPGILDDPSIAIFARMTAGSIDAGCIANRSAAVVGLSNVFAHGVTVADVHRDAAACATAFAPGLPVAGYERGDALAAALAAGFERCGNLRVWLLD